MTLNHALYSINGLINSTKSVKYFSMYYLNNSVLGVYGTSFFIFFASIEFFYIDLVYLSSIVKFY